MISDLVSELAKSKVVVLNNAKSFFLSTSAMRYDPDLNILYIPKESIKKLSPTNVNEYDLFFSVNREDDNEVIKLLEIDPQ